jgi:hypothetical protein
MHKLRAIFPILSSVLLKLKKAKPTFAVQKPACIVEGFRFADFGFHNHLMMRQLASRI